MKRGRFTEEQIVAVLREHEAGAELPTWLLSTASRKRRCTTGKQSTAACVRSPATSDARRREPQAEEAPGGIDTVHLQT